MERRSRSTDFLILAAVWLALRIVFFEGFWGYDDLVHLRYVLDPGVPQDVFEARLLFNGLLLICYRLFGFAEWAFALPALTGSALFVAACYRAGDRWFGDGLSAALFAALLPIDVIFSTVPMSTALANGVVAWGVYFALDGHDRRSEALAGLLLALGMSCHLVLAMFVLPLIMVAAWCRGAGRPVAVAGAAGRLFLWTSACFMVWDMAAFAWLSGDPLHHLELLRSTHLADQVYVVPRFTPNGAARAAWWLWPLGRVMVSKHFWLLLSLPAGLTLARWRSTSPRARTLALVVVGGWLYSSFGTQHPFAYAPIDRQERYWYGLAMPACLLATSVLGSLENRWRRAAWVLVLGLPLPWLVLASGSWGQNMEVSRILLDHVRSQPGVAFLTDGQSFKEMTLWARNEPPPNLEILEGTGLPPWDPRPVRSRSAVAAGDVFLFNRLNAERWNGARFAPWVRQHCRLEVAVPARANRLGRWLPLVGGWLPVRRPAIEWGSCDLGQGRSRPSSGVEDHRVP